jgi:hypothetical protein
MPVPDPSISIGALASAFVARYQSQRGAAPLGGASFELSFEGSILFNADPVSDLLISGAVVQVVAKAPGPDPVPVPVPVPPAPPVVEEQKAPEALSWLPDLPGVEYSADKTGAGFRIILVMFHLW